MKSKIILVGAMVVLFVTSAWAADVAGKWTAKVPGAQGQGDSDITIVFKVVDDKITGTLNNSVQPGDIEIKDAKITGDEISFSLLRKIGETETTVTWKGKISGDEIKFTRSAAGAAGGAPTEIVAKRAK